METPSNGQLEKNIARYSWYKIFTKRVYLPLITIQLVNVGNVTIEQLAIIVIISTIVQAVLQLPGGYLADRWGNRKTVILGAAIAVTSPLFYAFMPNFMGGLIASVLFFGGYAFQSGAIEALMHDTLVALKREREYAKVLGRAQAYGLAGNVILLILVPATYPIDYRLPFILGFISLLAMLILTISLTSPTTSHVKVAKKSPLDATKSVVTIENMALFIFAGFTAGVSNKGPEFRELVFQDVGIATALFGMLVAAGSLVGAVLGWYIHILDRLKPLAFYMLDLVIIALCLLIVGVTSNPYIVGVGFILFAGYTRVRMIVFQAKLLHELRHTYKSTLISALSFFSLFGDIIAITLLTKFVSDSGYLRGYAYFAVVVFVIGVLLWIMMASVSTFYKKATARLE